MYSRKVKPVNIVPKVEKKVEEVEVFVVTLLEDLDKKEHDNPDNKNPPHKEKFRLDIEPKKDNGKTIIHRQKSVEIGRGEEFTGPQESAVVDCADRRTDSKPCSPNGIGSEKEEPKAFEWYLNEAGNNNSGETPEEAQKADTVKVMEYAKLSKQWRQKLKYNGTIKQYGDLFHILYSPDDWKSPRRPIANSPNEQSLLRDGIIDGARQGIIRRELLREFGVNPGTEEKN
ncbi:4637_t:CDS:2, partial [Racocetra persica]